MRHTARRFAVLLLGACATTAEPLPPYDEDARMLGADVATAKGGAVAAIVDVANIAHGGLPDGFFRGAWGHIRGSHDGIEYVYVVWCDGKPATCDEWTDAAHALVGWGGTMETERGPLTVWHQGMWDVEGLHAGLGLAKATGWSAYGVDGDLVIESELQLVFDFAAGKPLAGAVQAAFYDVDSTDGALHESRHGDVIFDDADRATIMLDDHRYWIDLATGDVTAATVVE